MESDSDSLDNCYEDVVADPLPDEINADEHAVPLDDDFGADKLIKDLSEDMIDAEDYRGEIKGLI